MKALCLAFCVLTTLLLAAVCVSPARADWCHGGEVPSLEWLVDVGNVVVGEVVEESGTGRYTIRITEILKRSKEFAAKQGDVVNCRAHARWPNPDWKEDDPVVVFFGKDTTLVRSLVNLIRPEAIWNQPEEPYLTVDKHGKIVLDREEFMRRVRARIEKNVVSDDGFMPVREDGFEYFPKVCEIDGDSEYYSLRVPPDPCFREMLEEAANRYAHPSFPGGSIWAESALFRYYSDVADEEKEEHRKKAVRAACEFAKIMQSRREGRFSVVNYYTHPDPHGWLGSVSPNGRYLALLAGGTVELHDLESGDTLYTNDGSYVHHGRELSMVFAADNKHFAHLHAGGDVTLFDLKRKEVKQTFKFAWEPQSNMFICVLSFSPDSRYLAFLMHSGRGGWGCALQVWNVDTGKTLLKPSDDWRTQFRMEGFSRDSKLLKVETLVYGGREWKLVNQVWNLDTGRLTDEPPAGEWLVPAAPHNSHLPLGRNSAETPPRAETLDGKLRAEVMLGEAQRLVIRQVESGNIVRSLDLTGMPPVRDVFFSSGGDAVFLVIGRETAWMFNIDENQPRPTKFNCLD